MGQRRAIHAARRRPGWPERRMASRGLRHYPVPAGLRSLRNVAGFRWCQAGLWMSRSLLRPHCSGLAPPCCRLRPPPRKEKGGERGGRRQKHAALSSETWGQKRRSGPRATSARATPLSNHFSDGSRVRLSPPRNRKPVRPLPEAGPAVTRSARRPGRRDPPWGSATR